MPQRPSCFARTAVALACAASGWTVAAQGVPAPESVAGEPLRLRSSPALNEELSPAVTGQLPIFLFGQRISGRPDLETVVEGEAELRRGGTVVRADRLEYQQPSDLAKARGNVRVLRQGNRYQGQELELRVDAFEGFFIRPSFSFLRAGTHGQADRVDFIDSKRAVVRNATYTSCRRDGRPDWMPDWMLRAASIRIDDEEQVGLASGARLEFKGVPILPIPEVSFPMGDRRKSGVLPPTIGIDNVNGLDLTLPYYWDIAPQRDATLYPTLMSKRGVNLGGEFRYLEPEHNGRVRLDWMPSDRLRGEDRWAYQIKHEGRMDPRLGIGPVGLNVNLNRVSDDNYWRDFSRAGSTLTQRLLPSDASLFWVGQGMEFHVRSLRWQTLQDAGSPITPPYDRAPQISLRYTPTRQPLGLEFSAVVDHTRFRSVSALTNQPNADRSYAHATLSRPWVEPGWFVVPKLQWHATHYRFDAPLTDGRTQASRSLPTFSLDAGLVLERDAAYFGRAFRQTLEPRAFYVNTPYRDQSKLPVYDSAAADFNFTSIFGENAFVGQDRLADNHLLTLGAISRLIDPASGAEVVRLGLAQRMRLRDQLVTLPGTNAVTDRWSDLLLGASVNWSPNWSLDTTVQFNPKTERSQRTTIGGRYSPAPYHVISAAYRLQRGASEQLDVGWQWPLAWASSDSGKWYGVGRLNYSLREKKMVDALVGLEYDAGCWIGRVVFDRLQSSTSSANKRILFQLEFVGFTRLGSNVLQTLKQNIPRYQLLREQSQSPSRFSQYE